MPEQVEFGRFGRHEALLVDGIVQSINPDDITDTPTAGLYWPLMLPDNEPQRALILGIGGGTLARLLLDRWPELDLTGVEESLAVLRAAHTAGWLPDRMCIAKRDAFDFISHPYRAYDYIAVDLYHGANVDERLFTEDAMFDLQANASGTVVFNLFGDHRLGARLQVITQHFSITRIAATGINVIAHCA